MQDLEQRRAQSRFSEPKCPCNRRSRNPQAALHPHHSLNEKPLVPAVGPSRRLSSAARGPTPSHLATLDPPPPPPDAPLSPPAMERSPDDPEQKTLT
nr:unnamed protein product [Digitaria exilis]